MRYELVRDVLFGLDAERSHELVLGALRRLPRLAGLFAPALRERPVRLLGLEFRNPVGLAAGLDKNAEALEAWSRLGFGFVEVGTVTPRAQPGNPRPRMFRLPAQRALINRLGFSNKGVDYLLQRVRESRFEGVLGINIGKNADTPIERAADDYAVCLRKVFAHAHYVTVNISSPNTRRLRDLQQESPLRALLQRLTAERAELAQRHGMYRPMLVKIAPDILDVQIETIARIVREEGLDGLIATNTTVRRPGLEHERIAAESGGLSGAPLMLDSTRVLRRLRALLGAEFPLIGVGGICSGDDARQKFEAGAQLVQICTGFIYRGPRLIAECAAAGEWTAAAGEDLAVTHKDADRHRTIS